MNLGPVAAPLAGAFGAAVLLRRWAYDRGLRAASRAPIPVISVGGLEAGGSGKTPVTGLLLRAFSLAGRRPGLLTRGYGREQRGMVLRRPGEPARPAAIGDEPAMLVASGLDLPVVACADRVRGAVALSELGCEVAVLDDAFSHRALARDLDIVVLRGEAPFGSGHLLPWGSLREPPSSLRRAQVVWLHHRSGGDRPAPAWRTSLAGHATWVESRAVPGEVRDLAGESVSLAGRRVMVVCGIARPADFVAAVEARGGAVVARGMFADHYSFDSQTVVAVAKRAAAVGAEAVVATAKDLVKLAPLWQGGLLWGMTTRVEIFFGARSLAEHLEINEETIQDAASQQP